MRTGGWTGAVDLFSERWTVEVSGEGETASEHRCRRAIRHAASGASWSLRNSSEARFEKQDLRVRALGVAVVPARARFYAALACWSGWLQRARPSTHANWRNPKPSRSPEPVPLRPPKHQSHAPTHAVLNYRQRRRPSTSDLHNLIPPRLDPARFLLRLPPFRRPLQSLLFLAVVVGPVLSHDLGYTPVLMPRI